jgi:hypothetical protein
MALNKAQLMEVPGGPGITGSVKAGSNITISPDGTISAAPGLDVGFGLVNNNQIAKVSITTRTNTPTVGTLPSDAVVGSLYWDNTLGALFIYYNSGTASQWVQVAGLG